MAWKSFWSCDMDNIIILTLKASTIICSRRQFFFFKLCRFFKNNKIGMIFHEDRLLADDSHEISYLLFSKIGKDFAKFVVCCNCDWHFKVKIV